MLHKPHAVVNFSAVVMSRLLKHSGVFKHALHVLQTSWCWRACIDECLSWSGPGSIVIKGRWHEDSGYIHLSRRFAGPSTRIFRWSEEMSG